MLIIFRHFTLMAFIFSSAPEFSACPIFFRLSYSRFSSSFFTPLFSLTPPRFLCTIFTIFRRLPLRLILSATPLFISSIAIAFFAHQLFIDISIAVFHASSLLR